MGANGSEPIPMEGFLTWESLPVPFFPITPETQ